MKKKLRQVTDGIHQTIYLSEFESQMMSTAYFYRLHDIYQSSTVYLAFPCNRTKRYEHSCGTMDIAGKMFFYSIANASAEVLDKFFKEAENQFKKIINGILKNDTTPTYCRNYMDNLSHCFPPSGRRKIEEIIDSVTVDAFNNCELILDNALAHYIPPFSFDVKKRRFLYQCLFEAIRLVALFHDVGHPPYSHIMESVLGKLYEECKESIEQEGPFVEKKATDLVDSLAPFYEGKKDNIVCLLSNETRAKADLHEQVGLKLLNLALSEIIKEKINEILKESNSKAKSTMAAYYITVAEFCIAILRETNPFFASLHRIVDGVIDADRMDYVERDTRNSGVNWGEISYKRLLESCKLSMNPSISKHDYFISFPAKMTEDINDMLIARYKIFSRINFHHRAFKTSAILQRLVYLLSIDFLKKSDDSKCLCANISDLWYCLFNTLSSYNLYIIQWNDSTLVSHLYHTLADCKPDDYEAYEMSSEEYEEILHMLEEFLLNKKHFHSVFKRQSDFAPILEFVKESLFEEINVILQCETEKLNADKNNYNAIDSMIRLKNGLLDSMIKSGDIDGLSQLLPLKISIIDLLDKVLFDFKSEGKIKSYLLKDNAARKKTGLPKKEHLKKGQSPEGIFLYKPSSETPYIYDTSILEKNLIQLQNYCLQYIVYIESDQPPENIIQEIYDIFGTRLVDEFRIVLKELFSCLQEMT